MFVALLVCINLGTLSQPKDLGELTIVADFPHLVLEWSDTVKRTNLDFNRTYRKPTTRAFWHNQTSALRDLKRRLELKWGEFYKLNKYSRSDPPPYPRILDRLSLSLQRVSEFLKSGLSDPYTTTDTNIKLLIYVAWRGGWCTNSYEKLSSGQWALNQPKQEANNVFSRPAPIDTGINYNSYTSKNRLERRVRKRIRNDQPMWRSWVGAFWSNKEQRFPNREEHSEILAKWWSYTIPRLQQEVSRLVSESGSANVQIEVVPYTAAHAYSLISQTLKGKKVIWLSQTHFRERWAGNLEKSSYDSHKKFKVSEKRRFINRNYASWPKREHEDFCRAATDPVRLYELFRDSGGYSGSRKHPFPKDVTPIGFRPSLYGLGKYAKKVLKHKKHDRDERYDRDDREEW